MTVDSQNTNLIEAEKIIVELLPNTSDRTIVLKQLLSSADTANSIAPNAWAVTLFSNGFRLNVGQVETLVFIDGKLKANLVGSAGVAPFIGPAFVSADYGSLPQPLCAFHGTVNEYGVLEQSLRSSHDQFIRLAASTSSGRPRKGTPFRSSHCEELIQYARNTLSAAEFSDMNDYVAYHSSDLMGAEYSSTKDFNFFSRKSESFLRRAVGCRVWVVASTRKSGRLTYQIAGVYIPSAVHGEDDGFDIIGSGTPFRPPIDVTNLPWFGELLREQSKFSFGFNPIRGKAIMAELLKLLDQRGSETKAANLFQFCVYTIVSRDVLDAASLERKPLLRTERKPWAGAKKFLDSAAKEGSHLPILLADAKDCTRLLYWGFLKNIEIVDGGTSYEVDQLRPLRGAHTPQELLLVHAGKYIAPNFIKPYALCHTPAFLNESPSIPEDETFIFPEEGFSPETLVEGAAIRITVNSYERNVRARRKCIEHYGIVCLACGFDFEGIYGEIGSGFIHVHHVRPLAEIGERYEVDPIRDLRPVCPNCHAMLHSQSPAMSIEELKRRLKGN